MAGVKTLLYLGVWLSAGTISTAGKIDNNLELRCLKFQGYLICLQIPMWYPLSELQYLVFLYIRLCVRAAEERNVKL